MQYLYLSAIDSSLPHAHFYRQLVHLLRQFNHMLHSLALFKWLSRSAGTFLRLSRYQHVSSWLLSFSADHHLWLHFYIRIHCSLVICKDACLFVIDSSLPHAHFYRQVFSLLLRLPLFKWLSNSAGTFLENRNIDDISFLMYFFSCF